MSTLISIFKPDVIKKSIPEIFCCNLNYFEKFNHIKIITYNFELFVQALSLYFIESNELGYQIYGDMRNEVLLFNNEKKVYTTISSILSSTSDPVVDLVFFDNMLPAIYSYGDTELVSIIKSCNQYDYDFYYNLIITKDKFNINDDDVCTDFINAKSIYFTDARIESVIKGPIVVSDYTEMGILS